MRLLVRLSLAATADALHLAGDVAEALAWRLR